MKFKLEGLTVYFPYEYIYPEQYEYMLELKRCLDTNGHCLLEMPTGTGKTITLLSLITSYQMTNPCGKLIYCTRTVHEMEKVLDELRRLHMYQEEEVGVVQAKIMALGLSSRKNLCIQSEVSGEGSRESVDAGCRKLTASWVRAASVDNPKLELCQFYEGYEKKGADAILPSGVYSLHDLRVFGRAKGWCPYFLARHMIQFANVVVYNYQYLLDPKVSGIISKEMQKECIVVFDEAHNIDNVCIEALSVNIRQQTLDGATRNLSKISQVIEKFILIQEFGFETGVQTKLNKNCHNPSHLTISKRTDTIVSKQAAEHPELSLKTTRSLGASNANLECLGKEGISEDGKSFERRRCFKMHKRYMFEATDANRLRREYDRLVEGLALRGHLPAPDAWLANPVLPDDILKEAVPGNIRRAKHFVAFLRRIVQYIKLRFQIEQVESQGPVSFLTSLSKECSIDQKTLKFCYDRLHSLLLTLEIVDTDEFMHIQTICDFATLVGTYTRGFSIIIEPFDERMPHIPDPVLQLSCLDASLAIKPVFERFQTVVITSGTLSPLDLYPRLLNFHPVISKSFTMTLTRDCLCPMVLTRGSDQLPVSTKFDMRSDPGVVRNYGRLLLEMVVAVPDGVVCFFVSYSYMDGIVNSWNEMGILQEVMQHKLVFIETQDVVETTLALDNYRRACDCGRGAVFFSVARGKVAEGIDFDRHYGRLVIMYGVPFQYTLSRILRARLEYIRETFQIKENDFLTFDAVRQAAQCVGRVIRSKADYGMMIFADKRYNRYDKRSKLPAWILSHLRDAHLNLSTDMSLHIAREFLRRMAQPYDKLRNGTSATLLSQEDLEKMES